MMYISTYKPCLQCGHHHRILLCGGGQGARAGSPRRGRSSHQSPPVSPRPQTHAVSSCTLLVISRAGNYPL